MNVSWWVRISMAWTLFACTGPSDTSGIDTDSPVPTDSEPEPEPEPETDTSQSSDTGEDTDSGGTDTGGEPEPELLCETVPRQNLSTSSGAPSGGVIFRYRSYSGSAPSWVSDVESTSLDLREGYDLIYSHRGPEVDDIEPFRERLVTRFGEGDYWLAEDDIDTEDLSIEAWFRTETQSEWQTLFSNTEGGGFSLKIKDGRLRGLYRVEDGSSWSDLEHIAPWDVSDGVWHHAVFTVDRRSDGYELCLWLDGESDCVVSAERDDPEDSHISPAVGAEPNEDDGDYTFGSHFVGDLYAVVVHDYVMDDDWLADRVLRDGSRYFDTPSYHDYLSGTDGVDQRVLDSVDFHPSFLDSTAARYRLPFQDDRYIVQGVGSHASGEIFLSMYYGAKDEDFTCSEEPYVVNSLIVGFDPCTSELTRVFMLYGPDGEVNMAHVGGMAVVGDDAWTTHQVDGETFLARYDLGGATVRETVSDPVSEDLLPSGVPWRLEASEIVEIPSGCGSSYMSYEAAENRFWLGEFSTSSGADVCVLSIDSDGRPGAVETRWTLPIAKVQGVLSLGDGRVLLSQSYSTSDSGLYLWNPDDGSVEEVLSGPSGFEDLALSPEGLIWTASESGARYFQKRFDENLLCGYNWDHLYPYAFALDPEIFLDDRR